MSKLILISLILLPFMINAQQNSVKNINRLSFELLKQINKSEAEQNIFISAYSISNALTMTYIGAKGATKTEMETILFPNRADNIIQDIKLLNESLSFNRKIELYAANNIWISQNIDIKKRFSKSLKENFNADLQKAEFFSTEGLEKARKDINKWVEEQTKNKIKDLIAEGILDQSTVIVLVNAVYYYAKWKTEFDQKNTYQDRFLSIDGNETDTYFMRLINSLPYYKNNELSAVEIPYENNEASFMIIMPDDFENFAPKLNNEYFEKIIAAFENKRVNLSFPKFKEESSYDMLEYFKNMGMTKLFGSEADLSGISGNKDIRISHIVHKAVIDINESGTEASASTAVIGSRSVSGSNNIINFVANRPFFYFVIEKSTGTVLFAGSYVKVE